MILIYKCEKKKKKATGRLFLFCKELESHRSKIDHVKIQCRSSSLKNVSGTRDRAIYSSQSLSQRNRDHRKTPPGKEEAGRHHFSPLVPQHKHTTTCRNQPSNDIHYLTSLYQAPPPHASADPPFPVTLASVLWGAVGPLPQKTSKNLANTMSPD